MPWKLALKPFQSNYRIVNSWEPLWSRESSSWKFSKQTPQLWINESSPWSPESSPKTFLKHKYRVMNPGELTPESWTLSLKSFESKLHSCQSLRAPKAPRLVNPWELTLELWKLILKPFQNKHQLAVNPWVLTLEKWKLTICPLVQWKLSLTVKAYPWVMRALHCSFEAQP